jgi:hypothetical protein
MMMMAQQMKQMPSLPTLASALCHIATIAVVMHGRTDLRTAPGVAGGSHRHLESAEPPHDPLATDPLAQTVARLEKAVAAHGARLAAVEKGSTEFTARLNEHTDGHGGAGHGVAQAPTAGAQLFQNTTGDNVQAQLRSLQRRDDELQASIRALSLEQVQRRGLQGAEPEPEPETGENVKIIKPAVVSCDTDPQACADAGKHRRAQSGEASCDSDEVSWRTGDINRECCNEPTEDCSSGYPRTCNAGCAALFLPFWTECRSTLGKDSRNFEPIVAMCEAAAGAAPSLARQLNVACSDGTPAAECVPDCCEGLHGSLMLLNIEGHDSKFACELRHGLYSWVGPAVRDSPRFLRALLAAGRELPSRRLPPCPQPPPFVNGQRCGSDWKKAPIVLTERVLPADGRRVPGPRHRGLLLRGGLRGAGGLRCDAARRRRHRDGPGRAAGPARQRQRRPLAATAAALGRRELHGAAARLFGADIR